MQDCLLKNRPTDSIALIPVLAHEFNTWLQARDEALRRWVLTSDFGAKPGSHCLIPDRAGSLEAVLVGIESAEDMWACAALPGKLPPGTYAIEGDWSPAELEGFSLGWGLGAYQFTRYKDAKRSPARLAMDSVCDVAGVKNQVQAIALARDLINTPAEDMMPEHLAAVMTALADEFGARFGQVVGEELLQQNYPLIYTVGRASEHPPRLLELVWGDETYSKVTLVGKGVCFDSGGLDLKPANAMRSMKKDMGGAAHVVGLARMIMGAQLPLRLRVLVPAVENAVAGNAYRPGDVLRSRQGLTIEIDNTDAEGRLILADALSEGGADKPDLMIDFATLTGAARVALGTEIPALFSNADDVATGLLDASRSVADPLWRLPLHKPYRALLDSNIADMLNCATVPFGGALTAALFLQEFVPAELEWVHLDMMAWNTKTRPGRPEGGEAMGMRAVFHYLQRRFGSWWAQGTGDAKHEPIEL